MLPLFTEFAFGNRLLSRGKVVFPYVFGR